MEKKNSSTFKDISRRLEPCDLFARRAQKYNNHHAISQYHSWIVFGTVHGATYRKFGQTRCKQSPRNCRLSATNWKVGQLRCKWSPGNYSHNDELTHRQNVLRCETPTQNSNFRNFLHCSIAKWKETSGCATCWLGLRPPRPPLHIRIYWFPTFGWISPAAAC